MRVIKIEDGKAEAIDSDASFKSLRAIIDRRVEILYPFYDDNAALICAADGSELGLKPNIALSSQGIVYNIIRGTCVICGLGEPNSAESAKSTFSGLPEELIDKYLQAINEYKTGIMSNGCYVPILHVDEVDG